MDKNLCEKKIRKLLEMIVRRLSRFNSVRDIIIRGSLARNDFKMGWSDIDLVIVLKNTKNITSIHKELSKITKKSFIPLGIDIVYENELPSLLGELFKIGFKSLYSVLETIKYGKSLLNSKYLKKLKKEEKIITNYLSPKHNFLFIQDYLWYLRREIRKCEVDKMNTKKIKIIAGLIFLIAKRLINIKDPKKLFFTTREIITEFKKYYPHLDITILKKLAELRDGKVKYSNKIVKKLCYESIKWAEEIYYYCLKNKIWVNGQKRR